MILSEEVLNMKKLIGMMLAAVLSTLRAGIRRNVEKEQCRLVV